MRLLRLIGPGDDGTFLTLETADGKEQFSLSNDHRLREVTASDLPRIPLPGGESAAPSPRDIQTRVRSGETPQSIADRAGISLERVMRFAYPVIQERIRASDEARRGRARDSDGHLVPFGELLDNRLFSNGVDPASVAWDAYRRNDGGWTVTSTFPARDGDAEAKFSFALTNRTVSALNEVAADLLSDGPVRALSKPTPEFGPTTATAPDGADGEGGAAPVKLAAVPDQPVPDHAVPAADLNGPIRISSRRQRARTLPVPVGIDDELFDQDAASEPWHEQPLPLDLGPTVDGDDDPSSESETGSAGEQESRHKRGRRADKPRMPSWDDILLGVRHKSD